MLNFVAETGNGGSGFHWAATRSGAERDAILQWERTHDTLVGGQGSDPHGWRNALNYYGWGAGAMASGQQKYDDRAYATFDGAINDAIRALIQTRRPVGMLAIAGTHADMLTGYWGLRGDPMARDASGRYTDAFTVGGLYLSDPFHDDRIVNMKVTYSRLETASNLLIRFQPYLETDSALDDQYASGILSSSSEWYRKFVLILPVEVE